MDYKMAVVLAAGEGKRMKSRNSKVVHKICGKTLVEWVVDAASSCGIKESVIVVGHRQDQVRECLKERVSYAVQEKQLGTGHAVMQAQEYLEGKEGHVIILCGDTPLITGTTIDKAIQYHIENNYSATVITADFQDPTGYGRIVRDKKGNVLKIVEHKDASSEEKSIKEINSGIYCFNIGELLKSLKELNNNNVQGEYYLTDTLEIILKKGGKVGAVKISDPDEILGINDRVQLAKAGEIIKSRILEMHMRSGVTLIDPRTVYIDDGVKIGMDTVIYPGAYIEAGSEVGESCIIGPNSRIIRSSIGSGAEIDNSVVDESSVGDNVHIGPFEYLRPGSSR